MEKLIEYLDKNNFNRHPDGDLAPYTTMKVGGRAGAVVIVEQGDKLLQVLAYLQGRSLPYVLLGGGSNVVFEADCPGLVVVVNRTGQIEAVDDSLLRVESGVTNKELLAWCLRNRACGMEFLAGIPGTVGGAAAVNAGAFGESMSDILEKAEIFTRDSRVETVGRDYFAYTYRGSRFKYGRETILALYLKYHGCQGGQSADKIREIVRHRLDKHPPVSLHTAGCFFKNPVVSGRKISAGKLIEDAGLKGESYRGLVVAREHANFLINDGGATFADIDDFSERIRREVRQKSGILLEREVIYISAQGQKR